MNLFHKSIENITEANIRFLIENQIPESRTLEYKRKLYDLGVEQSKRAFLVDVAAFANGAGGIIIFGLRAEEGIPKAIEDLGIQDFDALKLRFDQILRACIDPIVPLVQYREIETSEGHVFIVSVRRSWRAPHMVTFPRKEFWVRGAAGNHEMNVEELRGAFIGSSGLEDKLLHFRSGRLGSILSNSGPIELKDGPSLVFHLVPYDSLISKTNFSHVQLSNTQQHFLNAHFLGSFRTNFDGILVTTGDEAYPDAYAQLFRDGRIEFVDRDTFREKKEKSLSIPSIKFEGNIINWATCGLSIHRQLGIEPPIFLILSALGVRGYWMGVNPLHYDYWKQPIDRDDLLVPTAVLESFDQPIPLVIKCAVDSVWQAAGWEGSPNIQSDGKWQPKG